MIKKIKVLILIQLLLVVGIFIVKIFKPSKTVQTPIAPNMCRLLNEETCEKSDLCKTIREPRGPNRDELGMPLGNLVFVGCEPIPQEEIDLEKSNIELCSNIGGTWGFNTCRCKDSPSSGDVSFEKEGPLMPIKYRGCIAAKALCLEKDGVWKEGDGVYLPSCLVNESIHYPTLGKPFFDDWPQQLKEN